jgi:hypothetical protein
MAKQSLVPANGAVAIGAYVGDFSAFTFAASSPSENTTPYGANLCQKNSGAATPGFEIAASGFMQAHAANTAPLLCTATGMFNGSGAASTLTLDTGVTYAGQAIINSFEVQHGRMRAAVPFSLRAVGASDFTETYAIS